MLAEGKNMLETTWDGRGKAAVNLTAPQDPEETV